MAGGRNCPICKRPLPEAEKGSAYRPFCSKRCADVDLLRWLNGAYAIPAAEDETDVEGEEHGLEPGPDPDPEPGNATPGPRGRPTFRH
jgi:endogenous inhibitor of DNA gyrase (YacG/DUF329 family)